MRSCTFLLPVRSWVTGCLFVLGFATIADATRVRKDQASLSAAEKSAFVDALHSMKTTPGNSDHSVYDQFVYNHASTMNVDPNPAHNGPAFLPWHRQFIWEFETTLLAHDTTDTLTGLPYWNWALDQDTSAGPWTNDFLGGNGDPDDDHIVKTGPFREGKWELTIHPNELTLLDEPVPLYRSFGVEAATLPTAADVALALLVDQYDTAPWDPDSDINESFRNNLEGGGRDETALHNLVHVWVGGTMNFMTSPIDPVFWLHHAYVDHIWYEWQTENGFETYLPDGEGPDGHNLGDLMPGFDVMVADALDPRDFDGEGFIYQGSVIPEPTFFVGFMAAVAALAVLRRRRA